MTGTINVPFGNPVVLLDLAPTAAVNSATLTQSIGNFKRIKIFAIDSANAFLSTEIYTDGATARGSNPIMFTIAGYVPSFSGSVVYARFARYRITNGTALSPMQSSNVDNIGAVNFGTSSNTFGQDSNAIKIYRVEGYVS